MHVGWPQQYAGQWLCPETYLFYKTIFDHISYENYLRYQFLHIKWKTRYIHGFAVIV